MADAKSTSGDEPSTTTNVSPKREQGDGQSGHDQAADVIHPVEEPRNDTNLCKSLIDQLDSIRSEKLILEEELNAFKTKFESVSNELEREVQRRCDLEQRFTEEAKRSTDQIEELIAKSDQDDSKLNELGKKLERYTSETASMINKFTINKGVLEHELSQLRKENDWLLAKYIEKSRDLQASEIDLPQTVEALQWHCLNLNEKLILATIAKEHLEETLIQRSTQTSNQ